MRRRISQREARTAIRRVAKLEDELNRQRGTWASDWPGGMHLGSVTYTECALICEAACTARKLGHAVVAMPSSDRKRLDLYALPLAKVTR